MSDYSDLIDALSPASYWRLGEPSGTVATDRGSQSRNGTYINTPTLGEPSLVDDDDTAARFKSAQSELVNIGDFHDTSSSNPVTWVFWINTTSSTFSALVSKIQNLSDKKGYAINMTAGGFIQWGMWANYVTNGIRIVTTEAPINDGKPHCVMCTHLPSGSLADQLHIYIDGVEVSFSVEQNFVSVASSTTQTLSLAGDQKNGISYLNGTMDEIAHWRSTLALTDAEDIYAAGAPPGGATGIIFNLLAPLG